MSSLTVDQALQLAIGHHRAGRLAEAESLYQQILAASPAHADALHLLGVLAGQPTAVRPADPHRAVELITRAIAQVPGNAVYHGNLSTFLQAVGRADDAIAAARHALSLDPASVPALANLANALLAKGENAAAVHACRQALRLAPQLPEAHANLGIGLRRLGDLAGAEAAYREALRLRPTMVQAHNDLAIALVAQRRLDEAIAALREALRLQPQFAPAWNNLGTTLKDLGRLDEAVEAYRQALRLDPRFTEAHSGLIFTLMYQPDVDTPTLRDALADWDRRHAAPFEVRAATHKNDRTPGRRLRVGYVSADFREHVVARNVLPFFRHHDRNRFELFLYSNSLLNDAFTDEFRRLADHWRPVATLTDDRVAAQIREDRIDVLVDLSLHTIGHRLLVFARKPAPVQCTFAGYPGSTGLAAIDYRVTDPHLDPLPAAGEPDAADAAYCEKSLRLPHSFWCYEPAYDAPEVAPLPALATGAVTFGCLNSFFKINRQVLALWARVLRGVPNARILLQAPADSAIADVRAAFRSEGVDPGRAVFCPRVTHREYLALYHQIDIGLDTIPYNAHTTALDSLYMGVPLVTLVGRTVVGRAGLSQLTNLGLTELIARTPDEYVEIAQALAADLPRLAGLRAGLRSRMRSSPLTDVQAFTGALEAAYRTAWTTWCTRSA